jgi:hypothetical protein
MSSFCRILTYQDANLEYEQVRGTGQIKILGIKN